jgi:hypothetical protein
MGDIGPDRKVDSYLILMASGLIVLGDAFSDFAGSNTNNGIGARVIVARTSKDLRAQIPLLQDLRILFHCSLDDEPEKRGVTFTVAEVAASDDAL